MLHRYCHLESKQNFLDDKNSSNYKQESNSVQLYSTPVRLHLKYAVRVVIQTEVYKPDRINLTEKDKDDRGLAIGK